MPSATKRDRPREIPVMPMPRSFRDALHLARSARPRSISNGLAEIHRNWSLASALSTIAGEHRHPRQGIIGAPLPELSHHVVGRSFATRLQLSVSVRCTLAHRIADTVSWEAGSQNWTDDMMAQSGSGAPMIPCLGCRCSPGKWSKAAEASDQFPWDFLQDIGDLIADEHYGQGASISEKRASAITGISRGRSRLRCRWHGSEEAQRHPMSAMWTQVPGVNKEQYGYNADDRESASVAHIYGQNLCGGGVSDGGSRALGVVRRRTTQADGGPGVY